MKVLEPDISLFYVNYKEPLKKIENGFGYYGTVATDSTGDYVQCHICGNLFESLGGHLRKHDISSQGYKDRFKLGRGTALVGEALRSAMIEGHRLQPNGKGELRPGLVKYMQDIEAGILPAHSGNGGYKKSLESYNKVGLCPDQTLKVIKDVAVELGHTPSWEEFKLKRRGRYYGPIKTHFGTWNNAVRLAGMIPVGEAHKDATSRKMLLEYLKDFYKRNKRTPMNSDFKRGVIVARYNFYKEFGTLNNARVAAGIPAVIPLPGQRYIEVPAEEYSQYEGYISMNPNKRKRNTGKLLEEFGWSVKPNLSHPSLKEVLT